MFVSKSRLKKLEEMIQSLEVQIETCQSATRYTVYEDWWEKKTQVERTEYMTMRPHYPNNTMDFDLKDVVARLADHCGLKVTGLRGANRLIVEKKEA